MATRKEREREQQKRAERREAWMAKERQQGSPKLLTVEDLKEAGHSRVVLVVRTSSRNGKEQKLPGQTLKGLEEARHHGIKVIRVIAMQETARTPDLEERPTMKQAAGTAKKYGAAVLALTPSRLLRNEHFNPVTNPAATPTGKEWEEFSYNMGVPLAVCLPAETIDEDEAHLVRAGTGAVKGRTGKAVLKAIASELRHHGHSYREIAEQVSVLAGRPVSYGSVVRWLTQK